MGRRDLFQNITITLLAVSALLLFSRTQLFQLGASAGSGYWQRITAPDSSASADAPASDSLSAPVRTAVTGEYGRYGSVSLTTGDEAFIPVKTLLREVLGSARSQSDSSRSAFLSALSTASVYCDFLSSLPVGYIADLMGASVAESDLSIRALAASEEEGQVLLYLWDGGARYYRCATAVQPAALTELQDHFELGVSTFAFEEAEGGHLAPLSLFPDPLPELPQLTLGETAVSTETLLTALGFNPHTNSRYQDAEGAEVIVEGDRVIRISAGGAFTYASGGESVLTVDTAGAVPTVREAVVSVQSLLDALLPDGEAGLYLQSLTRTGTETVLTFGYQLGGVPIRSSDGAAAAEVTLSGPSVAALAMRPRQYTAGSTSSLLPLRQAMAIAGRQEGAELSIGYADSGAYPLSAVWLAD